MRCVSIYRDKSIFASLRDKFFGRLLENLLETVSILLSYDNNSAILLHKIRARYALFEKSDSALVFFKSLGGAS